MNVIKIVETVLVLYQKLEVLVHLDIIDQKLDFQKSIYVVEVYLVYQKKDFISNHLPIQNVTKKMFQ